MNIIIIKESGPILPKCETVWFHWNILKKTLDKYPNWYIVYIHRFCPRSISLKYLFSEVFWKPPILPSMVK